MIKRFNDILNENKSSIDRKLLKNLWKLYCGKFMEKAEGLVADGDISEENYLDFIHEIDMAKVFGKKKKNKVPPVNEPSGDYQPTYTSNMCGYETTPHGCGQSGAPLYGGGGGCGSSRNVGC